MKRSRWWRWLVGMACLAGCTLTLAVTAAPRPPGQPNVGPGGSTYAHGAVTKSRYGEGPYAYWLFEPAKPTPPSAPVVIFNHGWSATNPKSYGAWIEHLVRRSNIVIYPVYQEPGTFRYPPTQITPNAIAAVREAIATLQSGGHVEPQLDRMAVVGHSAGGLVTVNMAALAREAGLPQLKAVMCVQPGRSQTLASKMAIPLEDVSRIPAGTLLLTVTGDADRITGGVDAKKIFYGTTQIPASDKDFVTLVSDDHGEPALHANHFAPVAVDNAYDDGLSRENRGEGSPRRGGLFAALIKQRLTNRFRQHREADDAAPDIGRAVRGGEGAVDALDYYGTWKLFDALCDAAFHGTNREYALGNAPQQRFMGTWSDGIPVKELVVTDRP